MHTLSFLVTSRFRKCMPVTPFREPFCSPFVRACVRACLPACLPALVPCPLSKREVEAHLLRAALLTLCLHASKSTPSHPARHYRSSGSTSRSLACLHAGSIASPWTQLQGCSPTESCILSASSVHFGRAFPPSSSSPSPRLTSLHELLLAATTATAGSSFTLAPPLSRSPAPHIHLGLRRHIALLSLASPLCTLCTSTASRLSGPLAPPHSLALDHLSPFSFPSSTTRRRCSHSFFLLPPPSTRPHNFYLQHSALSSNDSAAVRSKLSQASRLPTRVVGFIPTLLTSIPLAAHETPRFHARASFGLAAASLYLLSSPPASFAASLGHTG